MKCIELIVTSLSFKTTGRSKPRQQTSRASPSEVTPIIRLLRQCLLTTAVSFMFSFVFTSSALSSTSPPIRTSKMAVFAQRRLTEPCSTLIGCLGGALGAGANLAWLPRCRWDAVSGLGRERWRQLPGWLGLGTKNLMESSEQKDDKERWHMSRHCQQRKG